MYLLPRVSERPKDITVVHVIPLPTDEVWPRLYELIFLTYPGYTIREHDSKAPVTPSPSSITPDSNISQMMGKNG